MKLYPPQVEPQIPAFPIQSQPLQNGGVIYYVEIQIPILLNSYVNPEEIKGILIDVRTMSGAQVITQDAELYEDSYISTSVFWHIGAATRNALYDYQVFYPEQFYKFRVAFVNQNNEIGYYSSYTIGKCLQPIQVSVSNSSYNTCIGTYTYGGEITTSKQNEKIYSYRFDIFDENKKLWDTSGELIHNSHLDQQDQWTMNKALEDNKNYYMQYTVTTQNYYTISSELTLLHNKVTDNETEWKYIYYNFENLVDKGCLKVSIKSILYNLQGAYLLLRSSKENDYKDWTKVATIAATNPDQEKHWIGETVFYDYDIKHGAIYKYGLQKISGSEKSTIKMSEPVAAVLEDIILSDETRQLKIKYNPKISSFKTTILETKTDTIGGTYPIFYRNGNVSYKEFPVSGLISINSDENYEFFGEKKLNHFLFPENESVASKRPDEQLKYFCGVNLDYQTIALEREFKLEVLDWLNNGKPKLFKSPTEGNYLVRLMNVSLSPNDTLGRMIHTFNSTAYEVGAIDRKTLIQKGFVKIPSLSFIFKEIKM